MPVEIRELVIRAHVPDKSDSQGQTPPVQMKKTEAEGLSEADNQIPSAEWTQKVVDLCVKQLRTWLMEKSNR